MTLHTRSIGNNLAWWYGHRKRLAAAVGPDVFAFDDDFVKSPLSGADAIYNWTTTLVEAGVGGESTITKPDGHSGRLLFTTDNGENDGINTQMTGTSFKLDPAAAGPLAVYCGGSFTISDVTQSDLLFGLCVTDTDLLGGMTDGVYLRKVDGSAAVSGVIEKGTVEVAAAATYTLTTTRTTLEFYYEKIGVTGTVYFFAQPDGGALTFLGSATGASLPNTGDLTLSLHFLTGEAAVKTLTVDWMRVIGIGR